MLDIEGSWGPKKRQHYHVKALGNEIQNVPHHRLVPSARLRPGLQVHSGTGKAFSADFGPQLGTNSSISRTKQHTGEFRFVFVLNFN